METVITSYSIHYTKLYEQGQTTLTDTPSSITWVLDEGSATQSADYLTGTEAYFESASVSAGTNLIYYTGGDPVGTRTANGGTFTCWQTNGKIDTASYNFV